MIFFLQQSNVTSLANIRFESLLQLIERPRSFQSRVRNMSSNSLCIDRVIVSSCRTPWEVQFRCSLLVAL